MGLECLTRGVATIDKFRKVHHEDPCPCPDGSLRNQLRCKCVYKSDADSYDSFLSDPLQTLKAAIELQAKEDDAWSLTRYSEVFTELPQFSMSTAMKLLVDGLRLSA